MRCNGTLLACGNTEGRWYTLANVREARTLCAVCVAVAANLGMDPLPANPARIRMATRTLPVKELASYGLPTPAGPSAA